MKQIQSSSKVIIIQPGSYVLRIGLATDDEPVSVLHCIARSLKDVDAKSMLCLFPHFGSTLYSGGNELITKILLEKYFSSGCNLKSRSVFFVKPESKTQCNASLAVDSVPFLEGLQQTKEFGTAVYWPIRHGHFNEDLSPMQVIQDLEAIWCTAIDQFLKIPRDSFTQFSVILVIEDVFVRREVRQLVDMLLNGMKFARVIVQQSSVCATYGVGLPTACVIDIGCQKTSISCVDEGLSISEARVTIPVGSSDCIAAFRSCLDYYGSNITNLTEFLRIFNCNSWNHVNSFYTCFSEAEDMAAGKLSTNTASSEINIKLQLQAIADEIEAFEFEVPLVGLIFSRLSPYFPSICGLQDTLLTPAYQVPSSDAPQPDDPFDDLANAIVIKDKKRKIQGPNDPTSIKLDDGAPDLRAPKFAKPTGFSSLAEAVMWSIRQSADLISFSSTLPDQNSTSVLVSDAGKLDNRSGAEMWRRMLGCILLVGGGATGLGGHLVEKLLVSELSRLKEKEKSVNCADIEAPIEVLLRPEGVADLAWKGAKLILNADSVSDLWFSPSDWQRYGSRLLRERAAFIW